MKKLILVLVVLCSLNSSKAQTLTYSEWFGTHAPNPNLWFYFGVDTLYYSFTSSGFTAMSLYTAAAGNFAVFDLPSASLCTDTGFYNYSIAANHLVFTLVSDACASRRNTLLNYTWTLLTTGISENNSQSVTIQQTTGSLVVSVPSSVTGRKEITIVDATGKEVYRDKFYENDFRIDISNLPAGIYLGNIKTNSGNKSFKIIK